MNTHKNKGFLATLFSHDADATPQHTHAPAQLQIFDLEGREPFMLQGDVAQIYGVEPKDLNRARKRNPRKFREDVDYFQLTEDEADELVTNCHRFKNLKHSSALPYGYTRRGAYMFATILQTPEATEQAFRIVEGFMEFERNQRREPAPALTAEINVLDYQREQIELWRTKYELEQTRRECDTLKRGPVQQKRGSRYTPAECERIAQLRARGFGCTRIARDIGRTKGGVEYHVRRNNL
jgi:hypothetical protein